MATRPVLAMSFYNSSSQNYDSPYTKMIEEAVKQKCYRQQKRKQIIDNSIDNIESAVENFFPEEPSSMNLIVQTDGSKANQNVKHYRYEKQYFEHIRNRLRTITSQLQVIEKQE